MVQWVKKVKSPIGRCREVGFFVGKASEKNEPCIYRKFNEDFLLGESVFKK